MKPCCPYCERDILHYNGYAKTPEGDTLMYTCLNTECEVYGASFSFIRDRPTMSAPPPLPAHLDPFSDEALTHGAFWQP